MTHVLILGGAPFLLCVCGGGVGISTEGGSAEDIRVAGAERRKSEPVREPFLREEPERELWEREKTKGARPKTEEEQKKSREFHRVVSWVGYAWEEERKNWEEEKNREIGKERVRYLFLENHLRGWTRENGGIQQGGCGFSGGDVWFERERILGWGKNHGWAE